MPRVFRLIFILWLFMTWGAAANAACSGPTSNLNISAGTINQGTSSVAVGSVIKTIEGKWDGYGSNASGTCGASTGTIIEYKVPGVLADGFTDVYTTNLQGVGMRLSVWTVAQATYGVGGGYYGTHHGAHGNAVHVARSKYCDRRLRHRIQPNPH